MKNGAKSKHSKINADITVLVCTLNEAKSLPHVLPHIPKWVSEVLLVDGNSTDDTVAVAKSIRPDARIACQPGKGKGDAIKYGVAQARSDIIVTLDADGETEPRYIRDFVECLLQGNDFAKGSRLAGGRPRLMPRHRWIGNKILSHTFNFLYGTRYTDVCSGYNAFRKSAFLSLPLTFDSFQMEQQMLAKAVKAGLKIVEIPHHSEGRIDGESKTRGLKQGIIDWVVIVWERFSRGPQAMPAACASPSSEEP